MERHSPKLFTKIVYSQSRIVQIRIFVCEFDFFLLLSLLLFTRAFILDLWFVVRFHPQKSWIEFYFTMQTTDDDDRPFLFIAEPIYFRMPAGRKVPGEQRLGNEDFWRLDFSLSS